MDLIKLKEICNFEKGTTGLAKAEAGDYPLVATGAARKTCNSYQFDTKAVCIPLVSSTGHGHASLKNVHYQEGKFALGTILVALTSKDENRLNIQFLHLYLSQLKDQILVPLMSGAANVALSIKKIQTVEIPLLPIERQKEIVENFKSIVIEDGQLKSELTHQQTLLKKLRQQILQEAIEGKLTADWRAQNPDVEPASKLLERIAAKKAQLIKEKKIKIGKKQIASEAYKGSIETPVGWEQVELDDISQYITDGTHQTPTYTKNGRIFLSAQNVKPFRFMPEKHRFVSEDAYLGYIKNRVVEKGDLLLGRVGAGIGETAVVDVDIKCAIYVSLGLIKTFKTLMNSDFLALTFNSPYGVEYAKGNISSGGGSAGNYNLGRIRTFKIPLPPLAEQQAIVTKVKKLFTLCDQLETQITQNKIHAKQLMQAVLKEAFNTSQPAKADQSKIKKSVKTQCRTNVVPLQPMQADYYKRILLAAEIVHQLHQQPTFGHLKLQKLIYLCQKTEAMQLPTNFLQQAAGPYDPKMARSLDKQLKDKKWFTYQREEKLKYAPLESAGEHQADFDTYFAQQKAGIHTLINLFRTSKSDRLEIVATLYACWERLLQEGVGITDDLLIERFYQWSDEKSKYLPERVQAAIGWMTVQGIAPNQHDVKQTEVT